jgi:hypothetical protein
MKGIDEILNLWPTMADLGRDLGLPYPTVAAWKQRGSIPVAYWRGIILAARRRGHPEVTGDLLIELHDDASTDRSAGGFSEESVESTPCEGKAGAVPANDELADGQFSRWKHLRRSHFATMEEIVEHVRALREEWDRR